MRLWSSFHERWKKSAAGIELEAKAFAGCERLAGRKFELNAPTITRMAPRNLTLGQLLAYFALNSQTPCPPRGAVPVNQECCGKFFHSQHLDRLR